MKWDPAFGWVYVMIHRGDCPCQRRQPPVICKIGVSGRLKPRLAAVRTLMHCGRVQLGFIGIRMSRGACFGIESRAHELLAAYRWHGEWFAVAPRSAEAAIARAVIEMSPRFENEREAELCLPAYRQLAYETNTSGAPA